MKELSAMWYLVPIALCAGLSTAQGAGLFPSNVILCSAKDPEINKCFVESANKFLPQLAEGSKQLGIQPLDPLFIKYLTLEKGNKLVPSVAMNISNQQYLGLTTMNIISANVKPKEYKLNIHGYVDKQTFYCDYEMDGSIVSIPVKGKGMSNSTTFNNTFIIDIVGEPVKRGDDIYYKIKTLSLKAVLGDAHFHLENLFNNKFISDSVNGLLNLASKAVIKLFTPAFQELYGVIIKDVLQQMFDTVPYKEFFTDLD